MNAGLEQHLGLLSLKTNSPRHTGSLVFCHRHTSAPVRGHAVALVRTFVCLYCTCSLLEDCLRQQGRRRDLVT